MRTLINERTRTIALVSDTHALLFRYIPDKDQCGIELVPKKNLNVKQYKPLSNHRAYGFIGLLNIGKDVFLGVITGKAEVASPIPNETVFRIYNVEFHCLNRNSWDFLEIDSTGYPSVHGSDSYDQAGTPPRFEQHPCFEIKKLLSDGSFFYSSGFDLTSTLQSRGIGTHSLSFDKFHEDYMWNSFMMEEIVSFRNNLEEGATQLLDENMFLTTVIRGFAETFNLHIRGARAKMTIISKQSWKRAGTRFNVRGVDDEGNVANFVETELILSTDRFIYAFTQIRGSIPIFWEQDTALISPKVQITRSFEATEPVFEKHFQKLSEKYGPIHIVNLLSTKSSEIELSRTYRKHVLAASEKHPEQMYLTEFDFHQETSKTYALASNILPMIGNSMDEFGVFCYDVAGRRTVSRQQGIFRTNCLDCLDRTNLVQQVISWAALENFLRSKGLINGYETDISGRHNTLWADHGDQVSQIYTGTNALKSSFSRSGKMGFAGALSDVTKSVSRIYINNFMDKGKQNTTDMLLGKLSNQSPVKIYDPISEYVYDELEKVKSQFTTKDQITVFTGTYNIAGIPTVGDLKSWLFPMENGGTDFSPDIIILGFQEVVELTASNILNSDNSKSAYLQQLVVKQLAAYNEKSSYVLLRAEKLASLLLLLFVKTENMARVTQVEGTSKKTGLGGMTANKGGVAIRFDYGATPFCVLNSHLAAGVSNVEERLNDYVTIKNGMRFTRNRTIFDHEAVIWLGDLNYRIALDNDRVRNGVDRRNFDELAQHDQLINGMASRDGAFSTFKEMKITFAPTYKYDKGTSVYDTSDKQRVPSWTDRILYRGKKLSQLNYGAIDSVMFSDHKPVFGTFVAEVTYVDNDIKHGLILNLYKKFKSEHAGESSSLIDLNDLGREEDYGHGGRPSSNTAFLISLDEKPKLPPRQPTTASHETPPPPPPARRLAEKPPTLPMRPMPVTRSQNATPDSAMAAPAARVPVNIPTTSPSQSPAPVASPPASTTSSWKPMQVTRSATATPVDAPQPPQPRPGSTIIHKPTATNTTKTAPLVPAKPKGLEKITTSSSEVPTTSSGEWRPMVPNK
ncbi:unnamed protein product [Kuraishia capsulata CBS 1993]|uniref:phosphoinositide 5-phosphatase n=1 Tax=Kuraishia capsulata CBS 1993 TaxID=1382522 RepID=W6MGZ2_9ASCO|nr:uncharacterized protein KUCA_T00001444001 [Kuraishia capsulata CBS 1993]CDK25474.1 unnamed protein product [Kuraishia capsulata CBS 1993]